MVAQHMFDKCIYFNLVTLTRKINKIWAEEFERLGLSPSHGYLLFAIAEKPDTSQKLLSELMELDASTITRFIDTLSRKGLVEKTTKGRGAIITITPAGKKMYLDVKMVMDKLYGQMQVHFGLKQFSNFVAGLFEARQSFNES